MALTGLQIQKLLPKTNCKECGSNTCLAFAMKLAGKKAEPTDCPYLSDEAKEVLAAESEPPIRTVKVGSGDLAFDIGGETVLCRHEKTFYNQTAIGLSLTDTADLETSEAKVRALAAYKLERVGELLEPNLISLEQCQSNRTVYLDRLRALVGLWKGPFVVKSEDVETLKAAASEFQAHKPVLAAATVGTLADLIPVAQETGVVLVLAGDTLDDVYQLAEQARTAGLKDLLLEVRAESLAERYQNNTLLRRASIQKGIKPLGFPLISFVDTGDWLEDAVSAGMEITKYGGIVLLPDFDPAVFASLLALRQNIYTDPQKPIQVEPKIYEVGEPDENSPVFVTTNFSLTYFIVSGEIENTGLSAWLVIPECEGMSVLTAWAAGKFGGAKVGQFVKESGLEDKIKSRTIVIPGYVAQISGELEEALPGWKVLVGPQEAGDIESYVKTVLQSAA